MSESTSNDENQVNDTEIESRIDDVLDNVLADAVESGRISPIFEGFEDGEASTEEAEELTEELEDEIDHVEEDAEEVGEEGNEPVEEEGEEEGDEDLPEEELEAEDDGELDMDYMIPVKIDGEASEVSMAELIKGYQTDQHQTKKGQELAEQAKELAKLTEEGNVFQQINNDLLKQQDDRDLALLANRKSIMDQVAKGEYVEGVDDDLATLKYKFDGLKDEYMTRKADRDTMTNDMNKAAEEQFMVAHQERVEHFQAEIGNIIPDWSDEVAQANYAFAVESGVPEALVASITDPAVAKFVDEFRRLKTNADKGAVKRKKAPVKKLPTKKSVPADMKKKSNTTDARKRLVSGKGSDKDARTIGNDVYDNIFDNSKLF